MLDLERALAEAAAAVDWPEADLVTNVSRRLVSPHRLVWRWGAAAVVGAALVIVVAAVPGARRAVADILGIVGIDVAFGDPLIAGVGAGLDLGSEIDPSEVAPRVTFAPLSPDLPHLGEPDGTYLSSGSPAILSMVWVPSGPFDEVDATGVAVLLSQFAAADGDEVFAKKIGEATEIRQTEVAGVDAIWIEGVPHVLIDERMGGEPYARLAANVLAWNAGGVTYRIEIAGSLGDALTIAESLRPMSVVGSR